MLDTTVVRQIRGKIRLVLASCVFVKETANKKV